MHTRLILGYVSLQNFEVKSIFTSVHEELFNSRV